MHEINGRSHLVFGQNFRGSFIPGVTGSYTQQIRSFDIIDDGTTLGFGNVSQTNPLPQYRRRDLNVFPTLARNSDGNLEQGLTALSGVFTESNGAWTVPVEIDADGNPSGKGGTGLANQRRIAHGDGSDRRSSHWSGAALTLAMRPLRSLSIMPFSLS